jgi:hypothetical protein
MRQIKGVSELLRSGVPLLNDLGLVVHWKIIRGGERFVAVTTPSRPRSPACTGRVTPAG